VVEWNRDNVFEHPALRNLPDGDLSGITLTYQETRTNCIAMDSDLFHTVSWPVSAVWAPDATGTEQVYQVRSRTTRRRWRELQQRLREFHVVGDADRGGFRGDRVLGNRSRIRWADGRDRLRRWWPISPQRMGQIRF